MAEAIVIDLGVDALPGGTFTFSPKTEETVFPINLEKNRILDFQDPNKLLDFQDPNKLLELI